MSRRRRLVLVLAAWALPTAWAALALLSGPSDGASIAGTRWGGSVTVAAAYGDTPLQVGDTVLEIEGRSLDAWAGADAPVRAVGDVVAYHLRRQDAGLDRIVTIDVPLGRYPLGAALREEFPALGLAVMPLVAGTLVLWRRPDLIASRALLAGAALAPAVITARPLGLGVIDLSGGRGVWPYLGGQVGFALALGCALLAALTLASTPLWLTDRPWLAVGPLLLPITAGVVWALIAASRLDPGAARLQTSMSISAPAVVATVPVVVAALLHGYRRPAPRQDRIALRLLLLALAGGLGVRLLLVDLPRWLTGTAAVSWALVAAVLVPSGLACVVIAMLRYRLDAIEPTVRRALVQALAVTVVGGAFVIVAGAVDVASDTSFEDLVAGGVLALLLLPLAVGLQRAVRHVAHGDRELPRMVVAELRELDPLTTPEDVLDETLTLLARRLHLSYAAISVFGLRTDDRFKTSIGELREKPTTVDLVVAGSKVGRLLLEVDADRDPFRPSDRRMLEDVGSQVGALVQAVSMNRELQRSRRELVNAREEERRRVRRDLHDGLGPSLATLAMGLEAAHDLIPGDPAKGADLVAELAERARDEIAEVRRLVDGLRPPALDQLGLVTALRQRAEQHNMSATALTGRRPMTWTVDAGPGVEPLPAAIEVAAYRIVVEAVNNASRHSAAATCSVELRRDPDWLWVRIRDSGRGVASGSRNGVGLASMRDRAEELGGSCTVTSATGTGTLVEARLPLRTAIDTGGGE